MSILNGPGAGAARDRRDSPELLAAAVSPSVQAPCTSRILLHHQPGLDAGGRSPPPTCCTNGPFCARRPS